MAGRKNLCTNAKLQSSTSPMVTPLHPYSDNPFSHFPELHQRFPYNKFYRIFTYNTEIYRKKKNLNSTKFDVTIASQCSAFYTIPITLVGPSALFHKLKYYVHSRKNSFDNPLLTVYFQIPGQTLWRDIFKFPLTNGAQKHICRNIFIVDCLLSNSWSDFMAGYIQKSSDQWRTKTHL